MNYDKINNRIMLEKAERLINDDEPTIAMYTDPNNIVFHTKLSEL